MNRGIKVWIVIHGPDGCNEILPLKMRSGKLYHNNGEHATSYYGHPVHFSEAAAWKAAGIICL